MAVKNNKTCPYCLKIILKRLVLEMEFKDINAMNVVVNLAQKEEQEIYKK